MSFVQPVTLQVIADSAGITKLSADAAKVLAPDVEYRLREIIQEAVKFKRHSKRGALSSDDISNALRLRNVQPVYGFANSSKDGVRFLRAAGHSDLYFLEDREASFDQVIGKRLPRPPIEVGLVPHWLVVDGAQPAIPENAPLERPRTRKRQRGGAPGTATAAATATMPAVVGRQPAGGEAQADGSVVRVPVKHVLSQELQLYFDKVSEVLLSGAAAAAAAAAAAGAAPTQTPGAAQPAGAVTASASADGNPEQLERAVFASLSTDPGLAAQLPYLVQLVGLAALVPYLVQTVGEGVAGGLRDMGRLSRLLAATRALLANPHLGLAPYLHQLLPPVLTCLVARRLGDAAGADHWGVRDAAARLVRHICAKFGDPLYNIQPRVSRTLLKALLDRGKPLTTHYGAIVGLAALGPRTVRLLLLPHLAPYLEQLQPLLGIQAQQSETPKPADQLRRAEALRCYGALQAAAVGAVFAGVADRLQDARLMVPPGGKKRRRLEPPAQRQHAAPADAAQLAPGGGEGSGGAAPEPPAAAAADEPAPAKGDAAQPAGGEPSAVAVATAAAADAPQTGAGDQKRGAGGAGAAADAEKTDGAAAVADRPAAPVADSPAAGPPAAAGPYSGAEPAAEAAAQQAAAAAAGKAGAAADSVQQQGDGQRPLATPRPTGGQLTAETLADAWREDSDLGAQLQAVTYLFGESVLPWVPFQDAAGIVL